MNVPRRPLRVSYEDLKELLNIPEEIDIVRIRVEETNAGVGGIELLLASVDEVEGITKAWQGSESTIRRVGLKTLQEIHTKYRDAEEELKKERENDNG